MTANPRVALIQMVSSRDVSPNLEATERLVKRAAKDRVDAVFLPENFAALAADVPRVIGEAEADGGGRIRSFLSALARETGCWIFAGTLPVATRPDGSAVPGGRVRAASMVYSPLGVELARYDKIHMFDVEVADRQKHYVESATFEPGEDLVTVDTPFGRVGLSVCYDIRFPIVYQRLSAAGATLLSIPSAFTVVTGEAHFRLLMRTRAVENGCFTIAACQGGNHDSGRQTYGHSMVCDPWGEVLGELDSGEGILCVDLNLEVQRRVRQQMPLLSQRRLD